MPPSGVVGQIILWIVAVILLIVVFRFVVIPLLHMLGVGG